MVDQKKKTLLGFPRNFSFWGCKEATRGVSAEYRGRGNGEGPVPSVRPLRGIF